MNPPEIEYHVFDMDLNATVCICRTRQTAEDVLETFITRDMVILEVVIA